MRPRSRGSLSDGDGLAQAVQQPFQVGHALAQFGELLLQGGKSLAKFLTLGGQFGTEVPTLGDEFPTLFRKFGADGPLPVQYQAGQSCPDRKDGYQDADQFNAHSGSPYPTNEKEGKQRL